MNKDNYNSSQKAWSSGELLKNRKQLYGLVKIVRCCCKIRSADDESRDNSDETAHGKFSLLYNIFSV